ncbi:DUF4340 domain-containing protein [bacterium]|nr:DUF4340 domain-containing protein [bacterium]
MLWKKTLRMLIAFAVLTGAAAVAAFSPEGDTGPALTMPPLAKSAIVKIEINKGDAEFSVEQSEAGDTWVLNPGGHAVNDRKIDLTLARIAETRPGSFVTRRAEEQERYGVGDNALLASVYTKAGKVLSLYVGQESADKAGNYVREPGDERVFTTRGRLSSVLQDDPAQWRDKQIAKFEADEAASMTLAHGGETLAFKKEGDNWTFAERPANLPENYEIDSNKVKRIAQQIGSLTAVDFKDDAAAAAVGLDPPKATVSVTKSDGETISLLIGDEDDKNVYARREGADQVYLISSFTRDQFVKGATDLRDMRVVSFDAEDATAVSVTKDGKTMAFAKTGDLWTLAAAPDDLPEEFVLDDKKVGSFVRGLSNIETKEILGDAPAGAGLADPRGQATVTLAGGGTRTIRVGAESGEDVYLQNGDGRAYIAAKFASSRVLKGPDDFKVTAAGNRPQQPAFTPEMLEKLPPEIREQFMQQQRQKIMQNQLIKQMMKKQEKEAE